MIFINWFGLNINQYLFIYIQMNNYQSLLRSQLLSDTNINYVVNIVLSNFKISTKAVDKCINIIRNNFNSYLDKIQRYPENNQELIEAIQHLNKLCYDDFTNYLLTKYPNMNLLREQVAPPHPEPQMMIPGKEMTILGKEMTIPGKEMTISGKEMIILSKEEKDELLKKYNKPGPNDMISYLMNPQILQMFGMIFNQMNCRQPRKPDIIIDEILDGEQLNALLKKSREVGELPIPKPAVSLYKGDVAEESVAEESVAEEKILGEKIVVTKDNLLDVQKKINELASLKNKYLEEKDVEMVNKIDMERNRIMDGVKTCKKKLEEQAKETESKLGSIATTSRKEDNCPNVEYLDLKFDPNADFNDQKNIMIKFKTDGQNVTDITLVNYYLPFNPQNVTRFNNKFMVNFNGRINKVLVPAGKYEIESLLDYIKSEITFLDFTVGENKIVTIKNSMNIKFDLMVGDDSILPLLGFVGRLPDFKDRVFYSGSQAYNMKSNEVVKFCLGGTAMTPMNMEFGKKVEVNKSIKKASRGIKQIILKFTNGLDEHDQYYYDFDQEFKMCFKVTYDH